MLILEVEPLDLGADVKAIGLALIDSAQREPTRGADAARVWGRVLPAIAGSEPWALDFFSHVDRVREFCDHRGIPCRSASKRSIVVAAPEPEALVALLERFDAETFGARAGGLVEAGDPALEGELARQGVDAYHAAFTKYFFCAVCGFEDGSLVVLSNRLWASEIFRRVRPALSELEIEVCLPV